MEEPLSPAGLERSALRALPVVAWASRFRAGDAVLVGVADAALEVGGRELALRGRTRVSLAFVAGPVLTEVVVQGDLRLDGRRVRQVRIAPDHLLADGVRDDMALRIDRVLETLVDRLADVEAEARAFPDSELVMTFTDAVEVTIPAEQPLTVTAAAVGSPEALRLSAPLVVSVHGASIRLNPHQLRWLGSLARIRVHRATLHPDGRIHLEGGGRVGLDRAVRGGLQQVSVGLSRLVRSSPRFARIRAFLVPASV